MKDDLIALISLVVDKSEVTNKQEVIDWFLNLKPDKSIEEFELILDEINEGIKKYEDDTSEPRMIYFTNKTIELKNNLIISLFNKYLSKNEDSIPEDIKSYLISLNNILIDKFDEYFKARNRYDIMFI